MTLIPSTRPCSLDCTSLSEPIRFFLLSVLFLFVLITSLLIYEDFASVSFGLYLPFINLCSAHVLDFSCCLLWSVPRFLQIYQGCLNCSLDYPSVCFLLHALWSVLNCSSDCTSYVRLPSHVLRSVLNCALDCTSLVLVISICFIYVKFKIRMKSFLWEPVHWISLFMSLLFCCWTYNNSQFRICQPIFS